MRPLAPFVCPEFSQKSGRATTMLARFAAAAP